MKDDYVDFRFTPRDYLQVTDKINPEEYLFVDFPDQILKRDSVERASIFFLNMEGIKRNVGSHWILTEETICFICVQTIPIKIWCLTAMTKTMIFSKRWMELQYLMYTMMQIQL